MQLGIHEAKTKLSKLIPAVLSGEEVIITKSGVPLVKLIPVQSPRGRRPLGIYADKIKFSKNFETPLPGDIINDFWNKEDDHGLSS